MRVVVDTNVLVAGLLSPSGPPAWIVEAVLSGDLEIVLDSAIRAEYEEVLRRPEFGFSPKSVQDLLSVIDQFGTLVAGVPPCRAPLPDPDDEPFLATAAAAECVLVTGITRHFPRSVRQGVLVLSPREFVDGLRGRRE